MNVLWALQTTRAHWEQMLWALSALCLYVGQPVLLVLSAWLANNACDAKGISSPSLLCRVLFRRRLLCHVGIANQNRKLDLRLVGKTKKLTLHRKLGRTSDPVRYQPTSKASSWDMPKLIPKTVEALIRSVSNSLANATLLFWDCHFVENFAILWSRKSVPSFVQS